MTYTSKLLLQPPIPAHSLSRSFSLSPPLLYCVHIARSLSCFLSLLLRESLSLFPRHFSLSLSLYICLSTCLPSCLHASLSPPHLSLSQSPSRARFLSPSLFLPPPPTPLPTLSRSHSLAPCYSHVLTLSRALSFARALPGTRPFFVCRSLSSLSPTRSRCLSLLSRIHNAPANTN